MQRLKSENPSFQELTKRRFGLSLSKMKIEPSKILQTLSFLSLGILSWLGFSYLFTLYIKILQGGSLNNFPWHTDAPVWAFKHSLAGAAIIIGVRWLFGLLSEKSKSVSRDFLILTGLIPLIALINTAFGILVSGNSYTGRKTPDAYDWFSARCYIADFRRFYLHRIFLFVARQANKGKIDAGAAGEIRDGIKDFAAKHRAAFFV
jgi:ABC-type transport system involved in multi-copper enzyme maturation permease subunit